MTMTWQSGRQLASINKDGLSATFAYDANGHRTQKTVNGVTTNYYWVGDRLQYMATGDDLLVFLYDDKGTPYGMFTVLDGVQQYFFYLYNAQGDVIAIIDDYAERVVNYEYGAWGELLSVTGSKADTVGVLNPFRYRGYCYDTETGLYYLNSRYYDPTTQRFLNGDGEISGVGNSIQGYNLFAYCFNNPICMDDADGNWPSWSKLLKGSAWLMVGITAVCVGVSVLTCGVAAPAMATIATITVGAGTLTTVNGAAEIGEAFTGYNVVRDTVFSGNQKTYDTYANITAAVAEVGTAVCGGWLKSPSTQTKIADKTLQNVIDNPNSITKLSTDKFNKIANKSSWEFKPTQNNKGYRALKGDMSIRYNMNGTRFDAAHFGGSPYWVISSAKNGTIKIMIP